MILYNQKSIIKFNEYFMEGNLYAPSMNLNFYELIPSSTKD